MQILPGKFWISQANPRDLTNTKYDLSWMLPSTNVILPVK